MYNFEEQGFDGRAKLSDGRANALPCPPLATPMHTSGKPVMQLVGRLHN